MFDVAYKTVLTVAGIGITGTLTGAYFKSQGNEFLEKVANMGTVILVISASVYGVRIAFSELEGFLHLPKVWGF